MKRLLGNTDWVPHGNIGLETTVIDSANDQVGSILRCPVGGDLEAVAFNVSTKTGADRIFQYAVQGANGEDPDGTDLKTADVTYSAAGFDGVTFGTALAVTAGQEIAIVLRPKSGETAPDGSNSITVSRKIANSWGNSPISVVSTNGGTSWSDHAEAPIYMLKIDGTWYGTGMTGDGKVSTNSQNDAIGIKFRLSSTEAESIKLRGVTFFSTTSTNNQEIAVYEAGNATPIRTRAIDGEVRRDGTFNRRTVCPFDEVTLSADTDYYIALRHSESSGASIVDVDYVEYESEDYRKGEAGGESWNLSEFDGSTWTDSLDRSVPALLHVSEIVAPSGGGGSTVHYPRRRKVR